MAKKKPGGTPPGFKTLQQRYRYQQNKLRIFKTDKTVYQSLIRSYRHEVSIAKKAGLIDKSVDARKVKPTSTISRQLQPVNDLMTGLYKTQKVTPKQAKELRDQGVMVVKDRAIIDKNTRINKKGQIVVKSQDGRKATYTPYRLTHNFEADIRREMGKLNKGEVMAAQFPNNGLTNMYAMGTEDIFINKMKEYVTDKNGQIKENLLRYVYLVKLETAEEQKEYAKAKRESVFERQSTRRVYRNVKNKEKRAKKRKRKAARSKRKTK
jgi:hypothetical protein